LAVFFDCCAKPEDAHAMIPAINIVAGPIRASFEDMRSI
jgi:hypothetical protein